MGRLICGDCRVVMGEMADNTIDSVVTDPPYELRFMGKSWDKSGIAIDPAVWREAFRVLKPGGHILVFGGTRTHHRLWCAIEDAGFQIRDTLAWVYGSGFPKSLDVSKAIDKLVGVEREVVGIAKNIGHIERNDSNIESQNYDYQGSQFTSAGQRRITAPSSFSALQWSGWGTGLKPALEPICLARKPLSERNVALNVLKWGTGGINVDGCRVTLNDYDINEYIPNRLGYKDGIQHRQRNNSDKGFLGNSIVGTENQVIKPQGRFPSNLIHDGSDEVMAEFDKAGNRPSGTMALRKTRGFWSHDESDEQDVNYPANTGSAARFFYCAKASRSERDAGLSATCGEVAADRRNDHATVKPLKLMRYLITLITPPGGIVLDPFAGSGSTLVAAEQLGMDWIGIELDDHYCELARKRINHKATETQRKG